MNLKPIIQSEVSQKEKNKYQILLINTYVWDLGRWLVQINLFAAQQWRHRHREETYGHREKRGKGEMHGESNMKNSITVCKIDNQWEFVV